mgnify:CR=1 FL=1
MTSLPASTSGSGAVIIDDAGEGVRDKLPRMTAVGPCALAVVLAVAGVRDKLLWTTDGSDALPVMVAGLGAAVVEP